MPVYRPQYFEHGVYHIYNRGVAKSRTFLSPDDYGDFLDILRYFVIGFPQQIEKYANLPLPKNSFLPVTYKADPLSNGLFKNLIDIIGYCLMPNHFHLLVQLKQPVGNIEKIDGRIASFHTIPELIRRVCITYSHKFNRRHNREGAVFQGRFKVKDIPDDPDVLQVVRYIHLNPAIAGLVTCPEHWSFSDYHIYVAHESMRSFQVTNTRLILSYFDGNGQRYGEFVQGEISERESQILARYVMDQDKEQK